jgi:hypothetical protein
MPYYHDKLSQTVYYAPPSPDVCLIKGKGGGLGIWKVSVSIDVTRADNYIDPTTRRPSQALRHNYRDEYEEYRDRREDAVEYFKTSYYPKCEEISHENYVALVKEYQEAAERGPTSVDTIASPTKKL